MNLVQQILAGISDQELKESLVEMKELEERGVLPVGRVRELARKLQEVAGLSANDARAVAQSAIYRIAAFKWAGL